MRSSVDCVTMGAQDGSPATQKRRYLELREMSEESKSGWPIEDISELTRQLKNEERRPIIGWFSVGNQDSIFATDTAPVNVRSHNGSPVWENSHLSR